MISGRTLPGSGLIIHLLSPGNRWQCGQRNLRRIHLVVIGILFERTLVSTQMLHFEKSYSKIGISVFLNLEFQRLHKSPCKSTYENIPLNRLGRRRGARVSSLAAVRWTLSRRRVRRRSRRPWATSDVPCP